MTKLTEVHFSYFKFSHNGVEYEIQGSAADVGKAMLEAVANSKAHETLPIILEFVPKKDTIDSILPEDLNKIAANRGLAFIAVLIDLTTYDDLGIK